MKTGKWVYVGMHIHQEAYYMVYGTSLLTKRLLRKEMVDMGIIVVCAAIPTRA